MKFKVGDYVIFTCSETEATESNGLAIIQEVRKGREYPYRLNIVNGQSGWLAYESEVRKVTKLDKALK